MIHSKEGNKQLEEKHPKVLRPLVQTKRKQSPQVHKSQPQWAQQTPGLLSSCLIVQIEAKTVRMNLIFKRLLRNIRIFTRNKARIKWISAQVTSVIQGKTAVLMQLTIEILETFLKFLSFSLVLQLLSLLECRVCNHKHFSNSHHSRITTLINHNYLNKSNLLFRCVLLLLIHTINSTRIPLINLLKLIHCCIDHHLHLLQVIQLKESTMKQ